MNSKATITLNQRLEKIANKTFAEDEIKLLLIEIRDHLKTESILREVCDFIAHTKRNKGICHRRIDSRYAKQILAKNRTEELVSGKVFEENPDKPWSFFSDKMLDYIKTDKIEKALFETVITEGLEEIDDSSFQKYYGLSKIDVRSIISKLYTKHDNDYYLKEGISDKAYSAIDNLLKFIRGTFTGKSAFEQSEIETDILGALERFSTEHSIKVDLVRVRDELKDIVVCILCIIHDSDFLLFDRKIAKSYLSFQLNKSTGVNELCLAVNADNFIFQIISTSIDLRNYIDVDVDELEQFEMRPIPWHLAERDNQGRLRLQKNGAQQKL